VNKTHARDVLETLRRAGAKAEIVIAETDPSVREGAVQALRRGELEVLVNVSVFSEGTDIPEIDAVHILRPSRSGTAYIQAVGRGTRLAPGKSYMELFDYGGCNHDIFSIGQIFGLPDAWEMKGNSLEADAVALEEAVDGLGISINGVRGIADLHQKLRSRETRVQLIRGSLTAASLPSKLVWLKPSSAERYIISWRNETREEVSRMALERQFAAAEAMETKNLFGISERIEVWQNELGKYEAKAHRQNGSQISEVPMGSDISLAKLIGRLESWIVEKRSHKASLMKKSAKWGKEPASDAQIGVLKRKGVPAGFLDDGGISKREASILMGLSRNRIQALFGESS
jgi:hypothetical protein